jgi:FkbM family methyltransferase
MFKGLKRASRGLSQVPSTEGLDIANEIKSLKALFQSLASAPPPHPVVYLGDRTLLTETWFGRKIYLDAGDVSVTPHIAWDGRWESWVTDFFVREIGAGDVFLDIGANCGFFSMLAAHLVGPEGAVVAIEPQGKLARLVRNSLSVNGFDGYARIYNMAVGETSGEAELAKSDFLSGSASLVGLGQFTDSHETVQVEPISQIVAMAGDALGREILPTFAKMDTEGFEELAWRGARDLFARCDRLTMCMEFSPLRYIELDSSAQNFLSMIREDGFDVFLLTHESREEPVAPGSALEQKISEPGTQTDLVLRKG